MKLLLRKYFFFLLFPEKKNNNNNKTKQKTKTLYTTTLNRNVVNYKRSQSVQYGIIVFQILLVTNAEHSPDDNIKIWLVASRGFSNTISPMGGQ